MTTEERFWSQVERRGDNECWPWTGPCHYGVPQFFVDEKKASISARRYVYALRFPALTPEIYVGLTCQTRDCVNPRHITALLPARRNAGHSSVAAVASWLRGHGLAGVSHVADPRSPFNLLCAGKRIGVKVSGGRADGSWQFNIHRHGTVREDHVDVYILRLEKVPGFERPIHLVMPAPLGRHCVTVSLRSLLTRYSQYFNRLDYIRAEGVNAGRDPSAGNEAAVS